MLWYFLEVAVKSLPSLKLIKIVPHVGIDKGKGRFPLSMLAQVQGEKNRIREKRSQRKENKGSVK